MMKADENFPIRPNYAKDIRYGGKHMEPIVPFEPITPFEPVPADTIPKGEHWKYQIKWDGTRIVVYHLGAEAKLYNRKGRERTHHYPELLDVRSYCAADSAILDGEVIALGGDGKPSFHEVMRRDRIAPEKVREMRKVVPITYMIFDIVYYNGRWINRQPLSERAKLLQQIVIPLGHVQPVPFHDDGEALFRVMQEQDMEGIVCKDMRSAYAFGGKDERWQKVKNYGDTVAVIGGFTLQGRMVNAVLLGQYDGEGKLWYIGHAGTGKLRREDWRRLTDVLKPMAVKERPFANTPERHREAYWVPPLLAVKVRYSEWRWREGRSLRQPSIQSFVSVPPQSCKLPWIEQAGGRKESAE
jgi:bifunctional non-homologous end joining protein LigD